MSYSQFIRNLIQIVALTIMLTAQTPINIQVKIGLTGPIRRTASVAIVEIAWSGCIFTPLIVEARSIRSSILSIIISAWCI